VLKQLFIAAILVGALGVAIGSIAQQSLADKVGPNGAKEDQLKQGGLGEFYSKEGKDLYFGKGGHDFGQSLSGNAKSSPNLIGANTAYYGSGECHSHKHPEACV
jgi:hypothetical protein